MAATTEASLPINRDGNIDMTSIAILEAVNTSSVQFHGQPIITAMAAGVAYVAMKPIVENLGMSWSTQTRKLLSQKDKYGYAHMNIPSMGGIQQMLCIPLRKLNGWLFSINPAKVRADIRDKLIAYQEECFTVLHDYWKKGAAVRKPETTVDDRTPLRGIVNRIMGKYGMTYQAVYKLVHKEFGVRHIDELSPKQTSEAIEYLAAKAIEGEFLGKQMELPAPKLDIAIPLEWWIENNAAVRWGNHENLEKRAKGLRLYTPSLDVTLDMLCCDSDASPSMKLVNEMESAGFDISAVKAEVVAMRKHLANVEYGMKAIAEACQRAGNKKVVFRGNKAEYVIS